MVIHLLHHGVFLPCSCFVFVDDGFFLLCYASLNGCHFGFDGVASAPCDCIGWFSWFELQCLGLAWHLESL
jgi:hypothetical protein